MKALVGAFNQEKALVGAFSVIVQLHRLIVCSTIPHLGGEGVEAGVRDGAPLHHQTLDPAAALRTQAAHASVRDFVPEGATDFELLQCRLPESE